MDVPTEPDSGGGGATPSLRDRARAMNPQPLVPIATCVFAVAMWLGSMAADASGFAKVGVAEGARALAVACLLTALAAGLAVGAVVFVR